MACISRFRRARPEEVVIGLGTEVGLIIGLEGAALSEPSSFILALDKVDGLSLLLDVTLGLLV